MYQSFVILKATFFRKNREEWQTYNLNRSSIVTTLCTLPEYSLRDSEYDELDNTDGIIHPGEVLFVNWESINIKNTLL